MHNMSDLSHVIFYTINIAGVYVMGMIVNISPIWKVDMSKSCNLVEKIGSNYVSVKKATVPQSIANTSRLLHKRLQFVMVRERIVLMRDSYEICDPEKLSFNLTSEFELIDDASMKLLSSSFGSVVYFKKQ